MRHLPGLLLAGCLLVAGAAVALDARVATPEEGYLFGHVGAELLVPIVLEDVAPGSNLSVHWEDPVLDVKGTQAFPASNGTVHVAMRPGAPGLGQVNLSVQDDNTRVRLQAWVLTSPDLAASLRLPGGQPMAELHIDPATSNAFEVHFENRGSIPFQGEVWYGPRAWSLDLAPGASQALEARILPEEESGILSYYPQVSVGDDRLPLRHADGEPQTLSVVPHRSILGVVPPIVADTTVTPTNGSLALNISLLGISEALPVTVQARAWFQGPPLPCQQEPATLSHRDEVPYQRWLDLELLLPWGCQAPSQVDVRILEEGSDEPAVSSVETVAPTIPGAPELPGPGRLGVDQALPEADGWRTVLWPGLGQQGPLGPAYGTHFFTDEDGTARWPGTYTAWSVRGDQAVQQGVVTIEGTPWHLSAMGVVLVALVALLAATRWP